MRMRPMISSEEAKEVTNAIVRLRKSKADMIIRSIDEPADKEETMEIEKDPEILRFYCSTN